MPGGVGGRSRKASSYPDPAIYRWGSGAKSKQSAKRTAENQSGIREKPSISVVRYTDYLINLDLIPALKVLGYFHIVRSPDDYPFTPFCGKAQFCFLRNQEQALRKSIWGDQT